MATLSRVFPLIVALGAGSTASLAAQAPLRVPLLEQLIGHWTMTGTVRGKPATYRLDVDWVLQHRFVQLHMTDILRTPPQYEARVFVGPDTLPGHLIGHWMDNTGAAYSVPPATGEARGDSLTLDFPYPTGAFHDSFVFDPNRKQWHIRLDASDDKGGWSRFAEYQVKRR